MTSAVRTGDTIRFQDPPCISAFAAVGGKRESEGPLAAKFDLLFEENTLGEPTWEKAESRLQRYCLDLALKKGRCTPQMLDLVLGGDLQNQCTATGYTMRALDAPFAGLYGACSTMAEAVGLAACLAAGGCVSRAAALASSHFCAAERQFRTPLTYGGKRTPTAQWTATAAGCCLVEPQGPGPYVRAVTFGRVRDYEICDINNMGAAMAPAAADTLLAHLRDLHRSVQDYDLIVTGDLGCVGYDLMCLLCEQKGVSLDGRYIDCGCEVFSPEQDVHAGGSGCGCSACCLNGWLFRRMLSGEIRRLLFLATGALMSTTTSQQGESIPAIAHAVTLEVEEG